MNSKLMLTTIVRTSIFNANAGTDPVIMKINNKEVLKSEFEYIYNKNTNQQMVEQKDLNEYVDLFVNFKLKVAEAEAQGLDTVQSFITELSGYRRQLAEPYMIDSSIDEQLAIEAYERLSENVEASHILVNVPKGASSEEENLILERINTCRQLIVSGKKTFEQAAKEFSDCPSKEKGGYLGYFGGFQMVYPFETAAFNTPIGEISEPFRTTFGYHIVKVSDKRKDRGEVLTAHIMKRVSQNASSAEWDKAKRDIDGVYNRIMQGADYAGVAKTESDDQYSAPNGGEYPWIGANRMPIEYENAAFELNEKGDVSKPFKTQVGWHIVKLLDKRGIAPFETMKDELMKRVGRDDQRSGQSKIALINKLKKEYNLTFNQTVVSEIGALLESNLPIEEKFINAMTEKNSVLFTIGEKAYLTSEFAGYINNNKQTGKLSSKDIYSEKINAYVDECVLEYEDTQLESKYEDFRNLIQEYRDGILLFEVSNKEVWEKATIDTDGLSSYFKNNKKSYKWDSPKYKGFVVRCTNDSIAKAAKKIIKKAPSDSIAIYLRRELNNDAVKNVIVTNGLYAQGDNKYVDEKVFKGEKSTVDEKYPVVFLSGKTMKAPATYEDVRGLVTSDYQSYLEKSWIEALRAIYEVEIYQDVLNTVKPL